MQAAGGASASVTLPLLRPLSRRVRRSRNRRLQPVLLVLDPVPPTTTRPPRHWSYKLLIRFEPFLYSVSAAVNVVTVVALAIVVAWFLRWRSRVERVAFV